MKPYELDLLLKEVAPVDGFNMEGVIFFRDDATEEQIKLAQVIYSSNIEKVSFI